MNTNKFKLSKFSIQEYLSLGYIYLVLLGIISDVIYFKFLGVDILNYSTILDVLITPINIIVHDLRVLGTFSLFIAFSYVLMAYIMPRYHSKYGDKQWYRKMHGSKKVQQGSGKQERKGGISLIIVLIFSMFLGFGLGRGFKINKKIEKGDIVNNSRIVFTNGNAKRVKIVGQNSMYVFYVTKNDKEVTVCPITQNIREIKKIGAK